MVYPEHAISKLTSSSSKKENENLIMLKVIKEMPRKEKMVRKSNFWVQYSLPQNQQAQLVKKLKELNCWVEISRFKMEELFLLNELVEKEDWLCRKRFEGCLFLCNFKNIYLSPNNISGINSKKSSINFYVSASPLHQECLQNKWKSQYLSWEDWIWS